MLRLLILLAVLAALSLGASWVLDNNGAVELVWLGYEIRTSVAFLFLVVGILLVLLVLTLDIIRFIRGIPSRLSLAFSSNRQEKALVAVTAGFTALAINDVKNVRRSAEKLQRLLGRTQPLALLLAAESARLEGNHTKAKEHYLELAKHKQTETLGIKGLMAQALKEENTEEALKLARGAYDKQPKLEGVAPTLVTLYKRAGRFDEALQVVEKSTRGFLPRATVFKPEDHARLLLTQAQGLMSEQHNVQAETLLKKAHALVPEDVPVTTAYAETLVALGKLKKAETLIVAQWKLKPYPEHVEVLKGLYSSLPPTKLLKTAERLLKLMPEDAVAHTLMAEAALAADDLTRARNHAKLAMAQRETTDLCLLMARVEEKSGEEHADEATSWRRKATQAFLPAQWLCSACARPHARWQMQCSQCRATDSIVWDTSARMTPHEAA